AARASSPARAAEPRAAVGAPWPRALHRDAGWRRLWQAHPPPGLPPRQELLECDRARAAPSAKLRPDEDRAPANQRRQSRGPRPLRVQPRQRATHERTAPVVAEL